MKINADLSERVVINTHELPWVDSPLPGVQRRMLERDGAEVARATSLVRYAPNSYFHEHTHGGGEEFLVLDGVFSDEMGDFPAGMYVRNPVGSKHSPHTKDCCLILVKLRQFEPADQDYVRLDTRQAEWLPGPLAGLSVLPLHQYGSEQVELLKMAAGTRFDQSLYPLGVELYVLSGAFSDAHGSYPAGTWLRNPAGLESSSCSEAGCVMYLKTGHLPAR